MRYWYPRSSVSGCDVVGPGLPRRLIRVSAPVMWIGRLLRYVFPKLGMLALDATGVSRDPAVVADYMADPLVYNGKITTRLGHGDS